MTGDRIFGEILTRQVISNVDGGLARSLRLNTAQHSLGILTTSSDDVGYTALDEATKKADVDVVYAKSLYAGAKNATTLLAGEFIGILAGSTPEEVRSGLDAAELCIRQDACFISANADDSILYYAHCISRPGVYLSKRVGSTKGLFRNSIAYLVAPPAEAICGLDEALKAAEVRLARFYGPPTETNFAGGLLTGDHAACEAACEAFSRAVERIASEHMWTGERR